MTDFFPSGICMRSRYRKLKVSPWDSQVGKEKPEEVKRRQSEARLLCLRCPLLQECEQYLTDMECEGKHVSGVVAARYSDVIPHSFENYQETCRGCSRPLRPHLPKRRNQDPNCVQHQGEGLCRDCYPLMHRNYTLIPVRITTTSKKED